VPPQVALELAGELASFTGEDISGRVKLEVSEAAIDWFDLRVVLDVSDTTLSAAELKLLLNARGAYVRLEGKGWRRLRYDLSEDENERLARLGLSPKELSAEPQRLHALQLADEAAKKFLPEQQVAQIQRRASELKARVVPPLPTGVTAQLRPYQLEGFHFLAYLSANHFGGILADDMGLGKTLQALAWLVWLREQPRTGGSKPLPSLVVCPKSVMDNWHAEAARFTPGLSVRMWPASELNGFSNDVNSADVHVLNYSQLRLTEESLAPVNWLAVILDEGQYIKNPNSQTAQVARRLRAENRLVLSGTPIENRLLDLWSLMAFAMPGVLSTRAEFARLYDGKGDPLARRRLGSRVRPFLMRRTKAQVAKDLPDRIEEDLFCEIEGEQQMLYRAELKRAQQLLLQVKTQRELAEHQLHFLTSLLRLRQICCHPSLVSSGSTAPSAKVGALFEHLEPLMEEGQKVLVFSQFVELLALLKPAIAERNWPMFYLAGETENRGELVQQFQRFDGPAIFLISLKAGGFGLNLTAASYVVLFDPWWNPAVENQAIDRTHRIGQVNKVIAHRLLIKNSIEEKIRELQKQKKALAEDVFGEERFSQSLTLQDLQYLFAD
jgi:SNF2 family DNA or RNA helicase